MSILCACGDALPSAGAVENGQAFLERLREQGLHELALGYLQTRTDSLLVDAEFRGRIEYEVGMTLIDQARRSVDSKQRTELLQQAQQSLNRFAKAHPDSDLGGEANMQLGLVLLDRGRHEVNLYKAASEQNQAAGDNEKLASARSLFDAASTQFEQAEQYYDVARKQFGKNLDPRDDADKIDRRNKYRVQWLLARLYKGQTKYEKARSFPEDSSEFKQLNQQAAEELGKLHETYSNLVVGSMAHFFEGRANQAIGDFEKATDCYEGIVIKSDGPPEFRRLISQAYTGLAECWMKQQKYDEIISRCTTWLNASRPDELRQQDWLAVRMLVGEALLHNAAKLEEKSPPRNQMTRRAKEAFAEVARHAGPLQKQAQQQLASLIKTAGNDANEDIDQVTTFEQALQLGKDAFFAWRASEKALEEALSNSPDQVEAMQAGVQQQRDRAVQAFRKALTLVEDDTPLDQLNFARYYLAWLNYNAENYLRSAILGEFLARRYPDSQTARDGARIAITSYQQLYQRAKAAPAQDAQRDSDFEVRRMTDIADYVVRRWPDSSDASEAQSMLVGFAVREGRFEDAQRMLDQVPDQRRIQAELQLANGLWAEFLRSSHSKRPDQLTPNEITLRDRAVVWLTRSIDKATQQPEVSTGLATAALYLSQASMVTEDYASAALALRREKIGPLTLIEADHPAAQRKVYRVEAYKTALEVFTLLSPPDRDKAIKAIEALEQLLSGAANDARQLAQIYIRLGLKLRQRLTALRKSNELQQANDVADAFEALLDRLVARAGSVDSDTLHWVAQTYFTLATGGETYARAKKVKVNKKQLQKSLDTYDNLLGAEGDGDDNTVLALRKRRADVLSALGKYRDAQNAYSAILAKHPRMLDVQLAAAYCYQAWGVADARRYENAIYGGRKVKSTGQNRIWGWLKLSNIAAQAARTAGDAADKYRDWYFEARLNAARCRFEAGTKRKSTASKKSDFNKAKGAIRALLVKYPDLGGQKWYAQFDRLMREIQQQLKQKNRNGLAEFKKSATTS